MLLVVKKDEALIRRPEELVYRSCYAPVDLHQMLESLETRSRIRRLPAPQLFFGLQELDDEDREKLLPYVTQEQWTGVLDLDLWSRDKMSVEKFLYWQRHILQAAAPVARKLVHAADPEVWELAFKNNIKIYCKIEDDVEGQPEGDWLDTPDGNYLITLPRNAEKARLMRALILRLYELDPGWTALFLESCRYRTSDEIEETAYQKRTRRIEDLGFQDYYDAIAIYSYLPCSAKLPDKSWDRIRELSLLPAKLPRPGGPMLIFQAFATFARQQEIQPLLEELFFVCNRVLSADRICAADAARVKQGILKAITGMNLGLDLWSEGDLHKAVEGVRRHYLQSFFQLGYSRLMDLQREGKKVKEAAESSPLSFWDAVLKALLQKYPRLAYQTTAKIRKRFFRTREDLETARKYLHEISHSHRDTEAQSN